MGDGLTFGGRFELPATINTGERNDVLYHHACSLQAKGMDDSEIERALLDANATACAEPLPESEVLAIARHVVRDYPKGHSAEFTRWLAETPGTAAAKAEGGGGMLWTDLELSRLFAARNRHRLRYVIEARSWYVYDGTKWAKNGVAPMGFFKEFMDEQAAYVATLPDGVDTTKHAKSKLKSYQSTNKAKAVLEYAQCELEARSGEFDRAPHLLNVTNGTFDLNKMELRPHDPADLITKCAGCDYDPHADGAEWSAFLMVTLVGNDGAPDGELVHFMQRAMGAALICDTTLERMYMVYGETRTGKSTLLETVLAVFGDYGTTIQPQTLEAAKRSASGPSQDLARLEGVRIVVCPEPSKGMLLDVARAKQLTGGDTVTARFMYEDDRTFKPAFNLWFNTNYLPDVNDRTLFEGGRVVPVPFKNRLDERDRDTDLKARLTTPENLSAVLNWLITGCGMRGDMGFDLPRACSEVLEQYRASSDKVGLFIADRCELSTDATAQGKDLYTEWCAWCEENGRAPGTAQNLYSDLKRRPGIKHRDRVREGDLRLRNVFEGIGLKGASDF